MLFCFSEPNPLSQPGSAQQSSSTKIPDEKDNTNPGLHLSSVPTIPCETLGVAASTSSQHGSAIEKQCFVCKKKIKKHSGRFQTLITGDKKALLATIQTFEKVLRHSEIYKNIEGLKQLYYHKICRVDWLNKLKAETTEAPETKYQATRALHEKTFEEICKIIQENIIEKGYCYFLSTLSQNYTCLIQKLAEERGVNYDKTFSAQHLEKKFSRSLVITLK